MKDSKLSPAADVLVARMKKGFARYKNSHDDVIYESIKTRIDAAGLDATDYMRAVSAIARFLKI